MFTNSLHMLIWIDFTVIASSGTESSHSSGAQMIIWSGRKSVGNIRSCFLLPALLIDARFFQIYWPAAREHVEHCRLAGKSLEVTHWAYFSMCTVCVHLVLLHKQTLITVYLYSNKYQLLWSFCYQCYNDWNKWRITLDMNMFLSFCRLNVPTLCGCCSLSIRPTFMLVVPALSIHSALTCTSDTTQRYQFIQSFI